MQSIDADACTRNNIYKTLEDAPTCARMRVKTFKQSKHSLVFTTPTRFIKVEFKQCLVLLKRTHGSLIPYRIVFDLCHKYILYLYLYLYR
jgi:hypothetical protein